MPWQETNPVLERHHFAQDLASGHWAMTELCDRYGISRNTGYKWLHRYEHAGAPGLLDPSRAPRSCPTAMLADIVALILEEHTRFGWGGAEDLEAPAGIRPDARLARTEYDLRHPRAARSRAETASPHAMAVSRSGRAPHDRAEPGVDD